MKKKWTKEEERVILDQVTRNAGNIRKGLAKAAELTGRTLGAVIYHWYSVMQKQNTTVCFATVGHKTKLLNRKIGSPTPTKLSWWRKILSLLKIDA